MASLPLTLKAHLKKPRWREVLFSWVMRANPRQTGSCTLLLIPNINANAIPCKKTQGLDPATPEGFVGISPSVNNIFYSTALI